MNVGESNPQCLQRDRCPSAGRERYLRGSHSGTVKGWDSPVPAVKTILQALGLLNRERMDDRPRYWFAAKPLPLGVEDAADLGRVAGRRNLVRHFHWYKSIRAGAPACV